MKAELVNIKPSIPNQEPNQEIIEFEGPALETIKNIIAYSQTKESQNDQLETINYFYRAAPHFHSHLSYYYTSVKGLEGIAVHGQTNHIASIFRANNIIIDANTTKEHQLFYLADNIVVMYKYNPITQVYSMVLYPFSKDIASYLRDNSQCRISEFGTNAVGSSISGGSRWLKDLITVFRNGIAPGRPIYQ